MAVTGLDVNGALDQHSPFWAQLQATLNLPFCFVNVRKRVGHDVRGVIYIDFCDE